MPAEEVLLRVREMVESLRQPQERTAVSLGVAQLIAEAEAAGAQWGQAGDDAFVHLPVGAREQTGGEEPQQADAMEWQRERDQLRANVLALQQERDALRQRIRELEDQARATPVQEEVVPVAASPEVVIDAHDPTGHKKRMGDILVDAGIITSEQLHELLDEQAGSKHKRLGTLLVERGITSEEMIAKVLAAQLKLPYVDLSSYHVVEAAALQISGELARRHECVPIDGDLAGVTLAMSNPMDLLAIDNVELACKRRVSPVVAVPSAINAIIETVYS